MEKLYISTQTGLMPIDPAVVQKYKLEPGTMSPFTHAPIFGESGAFRPKDTDPPASADTPTKGELTNEAVVEIENGVTLEKAEIIDFGLGVDSSNG